MTGLGGQVETFKRRKQKYLNKPGEKTNKIEQDTEKKKMQNKYNVQHIKT